LFDPFFGCGPIPPFQFSAGVLLAGCVQNDVVAKSCQFIVRAATLDPDVRSR
jgi:hypothetical protein